MKFWLWKKLVNEIFLMTYSYREKMDTGFANTVSDAVKKSKMEREKKFKITF